MISTFENVADIGIALGLSLAPQTMPPVRSKRGALLLSYPAEPSCRRVEQMRRDGRSHLNYELRTDIRHLRIYGILRAATNATTLARTSEAGASVVSELLGTEANSRSKRFWMTGSLPAISTQSALISPGKGL